jgi:hypothetical protein
MDMTEQNGDWDVMVQSYAAGPQRLEEALNGIGDAQLNLALSDDSWSMRQIVHHLADGDDIWKTVVKAALGNGKATYHLSWYWERLQDEWVQSWRYAQRAIAPSLALFRANRRHVCQLLEHIPSAAERRIFMLLPNGEKRRTSVRYIVEMQTEHLDGHIGDIQAIRRQHGV